MKKIIIRLDDVGGNDWQSYMVMNSFLTLKIPVSYQVVPDWLTYERAEHIKKMVSEYPEYAEIVQHGYKHVSYHRTGQQKKFEFGFSRSLAEEYNDILSGNLILRKYFGDYLTMAFTAPWEAQSQTTLQALKLVGINILLASPMSLSLLGYSPEVRTILFDIDTSRKIDGFRLQRPPQDIINDINKSTKDLIGIVLHAKELESVDLFYDLASRLKQLEKNGFSFALIKNLFY